MELCGYSGQDGAQGADAGGAAKANPLEEAVVEQFSRLASQSMVSEFSGRAKNNAALLQSNLLMAEGNETAKRTLEAMRGRMRMKVAEELEKMAGDLGIGYLTAPLCMLFSAAGRLGAEEARQTGELAKQKAAEWLDGQPADPAALSPEEIYWIRAGMKKIMALDPGFCPPQPSKREMGM